VIGNCLALAEYCHDIGLVMNGAKTQVMTISRNGGNADGERRVNVGGYDICMQAELKVLGVTVDEKLEWTSHITNVTKKARKVIGILRNKTRHLPPVMRKMFYDETGRCHLEYCSAVVGSASKGQLCRLEQVENDAQRMIAGIPKWHFKKVNDPKTKPATLGKRRKTARFKQTETLAERRDVHLFKTVLSASNPAAQPLFAQRVELYLPGAITHRRRVVLPCGPRNKFGAKRPFYRAALVYNRRIRDLKRCMSV
jgi:hypothetical protein